MKPLQDQVRSVLVALCYDSILAQCVPTAFEDVKALLESETGRPLSEMFSTFDENPIGVASLAQVHIATERSTGRKLAVKIQV